MRKSTKKIRRKCGYWPFCLGRKGSMLAQNACCRDYQETKTSKEEVSFWAVYFLEGMGLPPYFLEGMASG